MELIIIILPYEDGIGLEVDTNSLHSWRKAALSTEHGGAVTKYWLSQILG